MPTYSQSPIRCRLSIVSNPPASPIDDNTDQAPQFWRAQPVSIQVGIFDADSVGVDLSNLTALQITFRPSPNSPTYYSTKVVEAADIIPTITFAGWQDGFDQQASFNLEAAETDFPLGNASFLPIWMDIRGLLDDGSQIIYGAGYVRVFNSGTAIPAPTTLIRSRTTILSDAEIKVLPTTGKTLIPAPGTGRVLIPLWATVKMAFASGGAYTNVVDASWVMRIGTQFVGNLMLMESALSGGANFNALLGSPYLTPGAGTFDGTLVTQPVPNSAVANLPVQLVDDFAGGTDYTGGNVGNQLEVTVYYLQLEL